MPADLPCLYEHDVNPSGKFLRHVILAWTELEKDLTVQRLQDGMQAKFRAAKDAVKKNKKMIGKEPVMKTQFGKAKVNGSTSILQTMKSKGKLTASVRKQLKAASIYYRKNGSLNKLKAKIMSILKLKRLGRETARRMAAEIFVIA